MFASLHSTRYSLSLSGLALFLLLSTCVSAQIVNIEDKRRSLDSLGWHGQIDLGANLTKNTNSVTTLQGALRLDRLGERGNVLLLSDYRLVQVSGRNAVNAGFLHLRYGYEPKDKWRWESFTQIQYNEQLRLTLRYLIGTGVRRRLYKINGYRAYVGALYMYEYDELSESSIIYRDHRLSNYLTLRFPLTDDITISSTSYYQPRLPEFNLARLSTVTSLVMAFNKRLRLTSTFNLTYDERINRDLPEVPITTYSWVNGLRYTF
ncbi:DUF481 domain-containing protein [Lewinella sp. 4G2]|uniref:DUF481 domain-containing protein n=1 Tax=Lewinella sp. 4G2 TaxID=1803372 RepID=UPI0007B4773F|nr:DUF481 domain-containing protein [Lewinella sp. 4G2]OAV46054.1 hypothetical protein A3850_017470 [Lewinella sp. 4G2]